MHGNELEPTWPKRANGLIKKGRAYRLAEDHICLTDDGSADRDTKSENSTRQAAVCPADDRSEETKVTAQERNNIQETESTTVEETKAPASRLTMDYILDRLEAIARDTAYLSETVEALSAMAPAQGPGDVAGQAKASALADIVRCRETTNQKLIDMYMNMYMKMYEDLRPKDSIQQEMLRLFDAALEQTPPSGKDQILTRMNALAETLHPGYAKVEAMRTVQSAIDKMEDSVMLPETLKNLNEILAGMELYH